MLKAHFPGRVPASLNDAIEQALEVARKYPDAEYVEMEYEGIVICAHANDTFENLLKEHIGNYTRRLHSQPDRCGTAEVGNQL